MPDTTAPLPRETLLSHRRYVKRHALRGVYVDTPGDRRRVVDARFRRGQFEFRYLDTGAWELAPARYAID